ncbi:MULTISPECIES: MarR family transcriptional regulator [Streptomyces]|uniref:MarR family transcriptional regulator n=2 Tax=Streptomyces TaxID=1883 RepID=A0ABY9J8D5_9ACTN|nr:MULTISPECIES: MarR family transcriptional regulator [unclassified Streptomyces]TXS18143.1 MarR family transcriptional regulator [Streptomyces sp. wa22]WLQ64087.1 MarR family transcriptional regulator [Streptomyces sp. Alt3]
MATQHPSSAPCAPAPSRSYRQARTGYGKRSVHNQPPSQAGDFALLPERERYVAGYVDHLPDGAAMDIKSLAKDLPLYGQMAIGTALRALAVAGHLRHVRCRVETLGQSRWVTRTYWSRRAHDNEWWATFLAGETPDVQDVPAPPPPWVPAETEPEPSAPQEEASGPAVPQQRSSAVPGDAPSPAYLALARIGRLEPQLALSAGDCAALERLAAEWFARGVDADYLTQALTSGLPSPIGSPVGFVRRRLTDKIPPRLPAATAGLEASAVRRQLLVECAECGRPGPADGLPDGLCRPCRASCQEGDGTSGDTPAEPPVERDVHALVSNMRNLMRTP